MMHPVKDSVGSRREVGATLTNPCEDVKKFLPIFVHDKHLMSSIPMQEKALAK
jgi:hypothetical protein